MDAVEFIKERNRMCKSFYDTEYAGMRQVKNDINDNDYELCVSCAHKLRKWFNGEERKDG